MSKLGRTVAEIADRMAAAADRGAVATYIPELAKVDPARFGLAVVDREGEIHVAGDADVQFSIQSVSKVFTLTLALGKVGERLWRKVGREPSGNPFNSIV
ncbi:MAG: glutaminase, partial [Hyphomicrobiales bacterium]|nr:glutaminase [Hyphomicrobiales bacterium]